MPRVTEEELLALKAKYLTAHSEYDRCVAALSEAGLRSATSLPDEILDRLAKAFLDLQVARTEYRTALFDVAFDPGEAVN
jgi:hypothetical protein